MSVRPSACPPDDVARGTPGRHQVGLAGEAEAVDAVDHLHDLHRLGAHFVQLHPRTTYSYDPTTGDLQSMDVSWGYPANFVRTVTFGWDGLVSFIGISFFEFHDEKANPWEPIELTEIRIEEVPEGSSTEEWKV